MSSPSRRSVPVRRHFTSSIPLWVRTDQPRQTGMDYWKGPHSKIISATPGVEEYRQVHLAESNPGRWPETAGVETAIPAERKIDGVAEVTFRSALSPLLGRKQTQLAYKDEINVFRRTLLYAGLPGSSRWYQLPGSEPVGSRALVYLRRRSGHTGATFRNALDATVDLLLDAGVLTELRTQTFLPWSQKLWDTPNVAHDNPVDQRFHASITLGFSSPGDRQVFFNSALIAGLSTTLAPVTSAIHAYDVEAALTFVKDGKVLTHYEG